jgi:hypothetical protein
MRLWRLVAIESKLIEFLRDELHVDDFEFNSLNINYETGIVVGYYEPQA